MLQNTAVNTFKYMAHPKMVLAFYRWGRKTRRALERYAREEAAATTVDYYLANLPEMHGRGLEQSGGNEGRTDVRKMNVKETGETEKKATDYNVVVFPRVTKRKLCFRECAMLIRIAEETECRIDISVGKLHGSTESLMTLLRMKIREGTSMTVTIRGKDTYSAFHRSRDLFDDKSEAEYTA